MVSRKRQATAQFDTESSFDVDQVLAERRQRRRSRILRLARAQLASASSALVERNPKAGRWYCMLVAQGREFAVETLLGESSVEALVPREAIIIVKKGKKIAAERPFLPGYVLVRIVPSAHAFAGLREQKGVKSFLGGASGYHVIADAHVSVFKRLSPAEIMELPVDKTLADGCKAKVVDGQFAGFDCVVVKIKWGRQKVAHVLVEAYGKQITVKNMALAFLKKL